MRLTTNYGLPVAEGTDPRRDFPAVVDGPRSDALDAALFDLLGGRIARAGYTIAAVDGTGRIQVAFPAVFDTAPWVIADLGDATGAAQTAVPQFSTITPTGCTVQLYRADGTSPTAGTFRIAWLAIGTAAS